MMRSSRLLIFILATVLSPAHAEQTIIGHAKVVDGNTLEIDGKTILLEGIDAPEVGQECEDEYGDPYPCGREASSALERAINLNKVRCEWDRRDVYDRIIGTCFRGLTDLNREMVRDGWAVAFPKFLGTYAWYERQAKDRQHGIWSGRFIMPERWRQGDRLEEVLSDSVQEGTPNTETGVDEEELEIIMKALWDPCSTEADRVFFTKVMGEIYVGTQELGAFPWNLLKGSSELTDDEWEILASGIDDNMNATGRTKYSTIARRLGACP